MNDTKERAIEKIVRDEIEKFTNDFVSRHIDELNTPDGTINGKKNNFLMAELGSEFVFYSAFVRSFDSSFGHVWENVGNRIASYVYSAKKEIDSFITSEQTNHIATLLDKYETKQLKPPKICHYADFYCILPHVRDSFIQHHACDNWFYDRNTKTHHLIELKLGGDLDNKKAKAEKDSLLKQYFLLKNIVPSNEKIEIHYATGYNKFGEGKEWHQANVERFFAREELLIGKDYWDFICNDDDGYEVILNIYHNSVSLINNGIASVKHLYHI